MSIEQKTIIAGPCAAESRDQLITMAQALKERDIRIMRACWWKPRTKPGFEGVGKNAAPWAAELTNMGITIGTEVLLPEHVSEVIEGIVLNQGNPSQILLWLGSRNQNHLIQREIGERMKDVPSQVKLMIKNQPWMSEEHWLGIVDHVTSTGFPTERIILCHRGFAPDRKDFSNLRNPPDWEMAMRVKEKTGLPMIVDPSHIGGSVKDVLQITQEACAFPLDGFMIEVHPNPDQAKTDARQQLSIEKFDQLLQIIRNKK